MSTSRNAQKARKSLKEKKRALYEEAILDAAERVFGELGYEATKVQRIAADAGVSLTTLYAVSESKWEIYRAVYRRRLNEIMGLVQGVLQEERTSLQTLIDGTRLQLAFFMRRRDFLRMQLKEVTAWTMIELLRSPEQVDALGAGLVQIAEILRSAIEDGYLIDDDPELMARTIIASQQVRLGMWMERGCKEDPKVIADAAIRHLLRSYCRPEHLATVLAEACLEEAA